MEKESYKKLVPPQVMELIGHSLHTVQYGNIILTVQDGCVIRMERTEKFIFSAKNKAGYIKRDIPLEQHSLQSKLLHELQGLRYGQLVIRLEEGRWNK